jgi:hypothetical protein
MSTSTSISFITSTSATSLADCLDVDVNALYCAETYTPSIPCGLLTVHIRQFDGMVSLDTLQAFIAVVRIANMQTGIIYFQKLGGHFKRDLIFTNT